MHLDGLLLVKRNFMTRATIFAAAVALSAATSASAADWILAPSTYSHDPQTGARVAQYAPVPPVLVQTRTDYLKSGYRHNRSSIFSGDGADNQHIVEQWGRPVRPYGEWLYPYRPYSVPYQYWGAPYAGLGYPYAPAPHWRGRGAWPGHNNPAADAPQQPWPSQPWSDGEPPPQAPLHDDWGGASGPT
jgi:hypothetical protein